MNICVNKIVGKLDHIGSSTFNSKVEVAIDDTLELIAGKTGINEAKNELRARIYTTIETLYPSLASKCQNQLTRRQFNSSSKKEIHYE